MEKRSSTGDSPLSKKIKPTRSVGRPQLENIDPAKDTLIFQELELDHYIGVPYPGMPGAQSGPVPVIRCFGVTKKGNSVCCHIHGFSPYFYINLPDSFVEADCEPFKNKLNTVVVADIRGNKDNITDAVLAVEIVEGKSLVEYSGEENSKFAKITVALPKFVPAAKRLLENQIIYQPLGAHSFTFFESNVDIEMRFMIDAKIMGCCWLELPAGKWFKRNSLSSQFSITSRCQLEVDVSWENFIAHSPEEENWSDVAQFRIHSFDIECAGRKGVFPEPQIDPIIQIANVVKLHGEEDVVVRNVFTLNTCAPIGHAEVKCFSKETDMLQAWAQFVRKLILIFLQDITSTISIFLTFWIEQNI
ncbi:hypothetical protein HHI36_011349 [Cryptolaemus montrouzieri]|uniref:DNA polymerase delta catalytic subunit n=1 Tax=Cryptolaemus montrouzieri TaxID=559131 RepID=A0ABD2MLF1_9CUCU